MGLKNEIAKRIEEFFLEREWTKAHFAKILDIAPQHVNKVLNGKLDPLNYIDVLVNNGADRSWLLTGIRENDSPKGLAKKSSRETAIKNLVPYLNRLKMRIFPIISKISAGDMHEYFHDFDPEKTIVIPYKHDNCVALEVDGDSMSNKIDNGDLVLVDLHKNIKDGDIVAVRLKSGEQLIKRYKKNNGSIILYSDNNKYTPITVEESDIEVVKKVVKIIKDV